jgi:hypothetical protein
MRQPIFRPLSPIRRQRQPSRIVPAREFDQRLHPGIHRRMGGKQVGKSLARVVDA